MNAQTETKPVKTPAKKGRGRAAKQKPEDIKSLTERIAILKSELDTARKHTRSWESKCDELWKKTDKYELLIRDLEDKIKSLTGQVEKLNDEIEDKEIDYKRLIGITQSLAKALYYSSNALDDISGGF